MNIDEMPAGRELDFLIAEQVMGWRWDNAWGCLIPPEQTAKPSEMWTHWQESTDEDGPYTYREPVKGCAVSGIAYNANFTKILLPEYSADIAAAWEILSILQSAYGISLVIMPNGLTECSIVRHNREFIAQALTAPLAICRAALKAVEKEVR